MMAVVPEAGLGGTELSESGLAGMMAPRFMQRDTTAGMCPRVRFHPKVQEVQDLG